MLSDVLWSIGLTECVRMGKVVKKTPGNWKVRGKWVKIHFIMNNRKNERYREYIYVGVGAMKD